MRFSIADGRWLALLFLAAVGMSVNPSKRKTNRLTMKYDGPNHQLAPKITSTTINKRSRVEDSDL